MDIPLITDSCGDTTPVQRERLGLCVVPLNLTVDGWQFTDDEALDRAGLMAAIKATKRPIVTSAPSPEEYAWCMRGPGPAVVLTLSSAL